MYEEIGQALREADADDSVVLAVMTGQSSYLVFTCDSLAVMTGQSQSSYLYLYLCFIGCYDRSEFIFSLHLCFIGCNERSKITFMFIKYLF